MRRLLPSVAIPAALLTVALAAAAPTDPDPHPSAPTAVAPAVRHLHLERSSPADSSVVGTPDSLRLWFSEPPQLALTRVTVTSAAGDTVPTGKPAQATGDKAPVVIPFLRAPGAGLHTVAWRTMSADGHVVRGTFVFTVRAATP